MIAADRDEPRHDDCAGLLRGRGDLTVTASVIPEAAWLIETRLGPAAEARFLALVTSARFTIIDLTAIDYQRAIALIGAYATLGLGFVDIEACLRDELDRRGLERRTVVIVGGAFVAHHELADHLDPSARSEPHEYARALSDPIERTTGSGSGCVSQSGPLAGRTRSGSGVPIDSGGSGSGRRFPVGLGHLGAARKKAIEDLVKLDRGVHRQPHLPARRALLDRHAEHDSCGPVFLGDPGPLGRAPLSVVADVASHDRLLLKSWVQRTVSGSNTLARCPSATPTSNRR